MSQPPQQQPDQQNVSTSREVKCPFCDSTDAEMISIYGQTLLGSQYYCKSCRSAFEVIRFDESTISDSAEPS